MGVRERVVGVDRYDLDWTFQNDDVRSRWQRDSHPACLDDVAGRDAINRRGHGQPVTIPIVRKGDEMNLAAGTGRGYPDVSFLTEDLERVRTALTPRAWGHAFLTSSILTSGGPFSPMDWRP